MDWSTRRRSIVWAIFGSAIVSLLIIIGISVFYKTPTCLDQKQNQGETGTDCGGPCSRACTADVRNAQVSFARAIVPSADRTDVIAYVANPNPNAAASDVHATVELYDEHHALLATREVTFDLPAASTVPVFVEGMIAGSPPVTQTFFTIDDGSAQWVRAAGKPTLPSVKDITWQDGSQPRVTATLVNPVAQTFTNIRLVATVFDADNQAIAASRTLVGTLPSQGSASMVFTWNVPFASTPARVEIVPLAGVRAP